MLCQHGSQANRIRLAAAYTRPGLSPCTREDSDTDSLDSELLGGSPCNSTVSASASQNLAPIWLPPANLQSSASVQAGDKTTTSRRPNQQAAATPNARLLEPGVELRKASAAPLVMKLYDFSAAAAAAATTTTLPLLPPPSSR